MGRWSWEEEEAWSSCKQDCLPSQQRRQLRPALFECSYLQCPFRHALASFMYLVPRASFERVQFILRIRIAGTSPKPYSSYTPPSHPSHYSISTYRHYERYQSPRSAQKRKNETPQDLSRSSKPPTTRPCCAMPMLMLGWDVDEGTSTAIR